MRFTSQRRRIASGEREFFIDNLLVRIHFIVEMIRWTGLAPWEFELPLDTPTTVHTIAEVLHRDMTKAGRVGTSKSAGKAPQRWDSPKSFRNAVLWFGGSQLVQH